MSKPEEQPERRTAEWTGTALKLALWGLPMVFFSGSLYLQTQLTADKADRVEQRAVSHDALPGHPVLTQRVTALESETREMLHEQRVIRQEQQRVIENISAICQATNARCR